MRLMTDSQSDRPTISELVEGVLFYPIALVVCSTVAPGFTLCIPAMIFFTAAILVPVVAIAVVVLLAAAVVLSPFAAVRGVRALGRRYAAAKSRRAGRPARRAAGRLSQPGWSPRTKGTT
jgi:hypothetical protein